MGLLSKLLGRNRADMKDAARIYAPVMTQSRLAAFYGEGRFPDNYDGRIDVLTLNLCLIMKRLREFGRNGDILSQAIFDTLRDDFEIALREEGLSDKGVAKRIKPMIRLFYDRLKSYDAVIEAAQSDKGVFSKAIAQNLGMDIQTPFTDNVANYGLSFFEHLGQLSLGEIATAKFVFPALKS